MIKVPAPISPNHNPACLGFPVSVVVLHWWGKPQGQSPESVIAHLTSAASQVSAHAVVWPGHYAQILPWNARSWANGNDWANGHAIAIECDPNDPDGTIPAVVELLATLVAAGIIAADFRLTGHRDYYATECPGSYYPRLAEIRQAVTNTLQGDTMPSPREIAGEVLNYPITRPDGHTATLAAHVADIAQRVIHIYDRDEAVTRHDGHTATEQLHIADIAQRVIAIYDKIMTEAAAS